MQVSLEQVASFLQERDDFVILTHQYPDGDTLGTGAALCLGLQKMGKRARLLCSDPIPSKYDYFFGKIPKQEFTAKTVVSVDVADEKLLGKNLSCYAGKVELCIDHHGSNTHYAAMVYVDASAAATAEILYALLRLLDVPLDPLIANCIYTGITTDTGCFKYTNATPRTYRIAAEVMEAGAEAATINRLMFDTKSRARMELERKILDSMEFYFEGRLAMITVTQKMVAESHANEGDLEGFAALPRQVEGVLVGVTLREKDGGSFKISLRTNPDINATQICALFGGGGHPTAAGCEIHGDAETVKAKLVEAIGPYLGKTE